MKPDFCKVRAGKFSRALRARGEVSATDLCEDHGPVMCSEGCFLCLEMWRNFGHLFFKKKFKNKMSPFLFSHHRFFPNGGAGKQTFAML